MAHGDAVVDGDGVELSGIAAHAFDFFADNLTYLVQMGVSGDKLCKRIDYGNDGLAKLLTLHARSYPEGTGSGHTTAFGADTAAQLMFHRIECCCIINFYLFRRH